MLSKTTKTVLFLSSYSPLFAILGFHRGQSLSGFILWGAAAAFIVFTVIFFHRAGRITSSSTHEVQELNCQKEVLPYFVTYLIPYFMSFNGDTLMNWAAIGFLLALTANIYVNSSLIYVNPVILILGWRIYEVKMTSGRKILITRKTYLRRPGSLKIVTLGEHFVIEVN